MGEVGGHGDRGIGSSPQGIDEIGDLLRIYAANVEGDEFDLPEDEPEERGMHFKGVLFDVGIPIDRDRDLQPSGFFDDGVNGDGERTEGRIEGVGARQGGAVYRDVVGGTEKDNSADGPSQGREATPREGRKVTGILPPRVRRDDRFRGVCPGLVLVGGKRVFGERSVEQLLRLTQIGRASCRERV